MTNSSHQVEAEAFREYLRLPQNKITPQDPVSRHHEAIKMIWEYGLNLAHGNPLLALELCKDAVKGDPQPGEVNKQQKDLFPDKYELYVHRLDGIPSLAFGTTELYKGDDKVQHFFSAAYQTYLVSVHSTTGLGELWGHIAGRLVEVDEAAKLARELLNTRVADDAKDSNFVGKAMATDLVWQLSKTLDDDQSRKAISEKYDVGDIAADDRGVAFGVALASQLTDPVHPNLSTVNITDYLPEIGAGFSGNSDGAGYTGDGNLQNAHSGSNSGTHSSNVVLPNHSQVLNPDGHSPNNVLSNNSTDSPTHSVHDVSSHAIIWDPGQENDGHYLTPSDANMTDGQGHSVHGGHDGSGQPAHVDGGHDGSGQPAHVDGGHDGSGQPVPMDGGSHNADYNSALDAHIADADNDYAHDVQRTKASYDYAHDMQSPNLTPGHPSHDFHLDVQSPNLTLGDANMTDHQGNAVHANSSNAFSWDPSQVHDGNHSTPSDANMTDQQGNAVHANSSNAFSWDPSQGHDGQNVTPGNANMTDQQGHSVHGGSSNAPTWDPGQGHDGHQFTPSDANMTDQQGHAVHGGPSNTPTWDPSHGQDGHSPSANHDSGFSASGPDGSFNTVHDERHPDHNQADSHGGQSPAANSPG